MLYFSKGLVHYLVLVSVHKSCIKPHMFPLFSSRLSMKSLLNSDSVFVTQKIQIHTETAMLSKLSRRLYESKEAMIMYNFGHTIILSIC